MHPKVSAGLALLLFGLGSLSQTLPALAAQDLIIKPGQFPQLTEPPCSYCSTENRKGYVQGSDRVLAWIRAVHNGGAIPLRHFLASTRIINDTYGLFFHDADGGYVTAYKKDYGYTFHGWRRGVMLVRGRDGTVYSALSGRGLEGPQAGRRLERIANFMTDWSYWLMLHPESTTYNLFDGKKYLPQTWPENLSPEAEASLGQVDPRLGRLANVLGVEVGSRTKAFPLDGLAERACLMDEADGRQFAVFWYAPTQSAVAFDAQHGDQKLTFYADPISPETAPFKDKETGTRWTLAGRGVDGPLRGAELTWMPSVQCRWFAWSAEYPETSVYRPR